MLNPRKVYLLAVLVLLSGGCMMDASKLAGFSQPKLKMGVDAARGKFAMEAGTDFQGKAEGHYNPETKEIEAKIEIGSSVSPVVAAEGERAEHLVELRKVEADMLVKMHELVGENIRAAGDTAKEVAGAVAAVRNDSSLSGMVWGLIKAALGVLVLIVLVGIGWRLIKRVQPDGPPA